MAKRNSRQRGTEFTGIKMERDLYRSAKKKAKARHQTYSEYVRQLIVRDIESAAQQNGEAVPA